MSAGNYPKYEDHHEYIEKGLAKFKKNKTLKIVDFHGVFIAFLYYPTPQGKKDIKAFRTFDLIFGYTGCDKMYIECFLSKINSVNNVFSDKIDDYDIISFSCQTQAGRKEKVIFRLGINGVHDVSAKKLMRKFLEELYQ